MFPIKSAIVLFTLLFFVFSCVKDVDFNQVDHLSFVTPVSVSFVHLELTQHHFLDNNNFEISSITDESELHIADFTAHSDNNEIFITSFFSNTILRDFIVEYAFFNSLDELLLTTDGMLIQSNAMDQQFQLSFTANQIENATKVRVTITMLNGAPLRPFLDRNLVINSIISLDYEY